MAVNGAGTAISNVFLITIRQLRTPDHLLGRVNATMRTITYGTIPLGALLGGVVGDRLGPRLGIAVGALLCLFTVLWVCLSPLRSIRHLDDLAVRQTPTLSRRRDRAGGRYAGSGADTSPR
jgi:predicted MFS family arabinose efflux permease